MGSWKFSLARVDSSESSNCNQPPMTLSIKISVCPTVTCFQRSVTGYALGLFQKTDLQQLVACFCDPDPQIDSGTVSNTSTWGSTNFYLWTGGPFFYIYIYTWNPTDPCFDRKRPYFGWLVVQNRGHSGSRYIYIYIYSCGSKPGSLA